MQSYSFVLRKHNFLLWNPLGNKQVQRYEAESEINKYTSKYGSWIKYLKARIPSALHICVFTVSIVDTLRDELDFYRVQFTDWNNSPAELPLFGHAFSLEALQDEDT